MLALAMLTASVFADDDKPLIARQVRRWRFGISTPAEQVAHDAVRAAAVFLRRDRGVLPPEVAPRNATQHAVLAVEVHEVFVKWDDAKGESAVADPPAEVVVAEVMRRRSWRS